VPGPEFIPPMLATTARSLPPLLDRWAAEPKLAGMRALVSVRRGPARGWSRTGRDVSRSFPELEVIAGDAGRRTLVLDGELIVLTGIRPDFRRLQRRMHTARPSTALIVAVPVTFAVFDLLRIATRSLVASPYQQRRALLSGLDLGPGVFPCPVFPGPDAAAVFEAARVQGLEGIVLKRLGSRYQPGRRSADWIKLKVPGYRRLG